MPRRKKEVLIKWMDRSCKEEQNHVNIKHIHKPIQMISLSWNSQRRRRPSKRGRQRQKGKNRRYTSTLDCIILFTVAICIPMIIHIILLAYTHVRACVLKDRVHYL